MRDNRPPRDTRPTLANELVNNSQLSIIKKQTTEIISLNKKLNSLLPKETINHIRVANIRESHLFVEVANAAIKMKLDYERLNILTQLRSQGFAKLISIEFKINPNLYRNVVHQTKEEKVDRAPLSLQAAQSLLMVAQDAPPKIKQRLENIAKLAGKR